VSSGLGSAKGGLAVLIETRHPEKCERLVHCSRPGVGFRIKNGSRLMDRPQESEFRLGDFQVQSGEVVRDARLVWKRSSPASFADRSCMETTRRFPDDAFLKASVRRWLE
jgi:hypothetical protein